MSRGCSTARRYAADNGPVVFGIPGIDVRWNRLTKTIVIEAGGDASWSETGDVAELLLIALAAAHRRGHMRDTLRAAFRGVALAIIDSGEFYRCEDIMCWRPSWQVVQT